MRLWSHPDCCRRALHRLLCQRRCTLTRALIVILVISFTSFVALIYHQSQLTVVEKQNTKQFTPPVTACGVRGGGTSFGGGPNNHDSSRNLHIGKRVLVVVESPFSKHAKSIVSAVDAARFLYKVVSDEKNLPALTHTDKGRFGTIIFEKLDIYLSLDYWNRQLIDKYCREYGVGMIIFVKGPEEYGNYLEKQPDFPLTVQYNVALQDYRLNATSEVWRILKPGETVRGPLTVDNWTIFHPNHSTYGALSFANVADSFYEDESQYSLSDNRTVIPALLDRGLFDGVRRVMFGNSFRFWLHPPMLLDCLSFLSHGKLSIPLDRFIQVDIDDIFVGAVGTRMKSHDALALVEAQQRLQGLVPGFRFMLGFSGAYYLHGDEEEDGGDRKLLELRDEFHWFPHMWRHEQPHHFTEDALIRNMKLNLQFAKDNGIPLEQEYSVAPHHSGVFPVHEPLYTAWASVWGVRVTSTEEYPKLYPSHGRRGFIHRNIMVLPRQTCGLFTHTIFLDEYPGGRAKLDWSIYGGDLFRAFLYNPVNIFMTHLSNYGNDRLGLYVFESAIKFVQCWTNLQLRQLAPLQAAIKYFDMFPEETNAVWRNPCDYERHLEIWSTNKSCTRLPKFLVIGPQKTGTTALYTFLGMHPAIRSNYNSKTSFEEVQFFSGPNYLKGLDWYMEFFPKPMNASTEYLFEKSATYFDNADVPMRAHALLPDIKVVCILVNPAARAYSWYQHMRVHTDDIALNMTFYDVVTAADTAPSRVRALRNRCLNPGMYAHHLLNWVDYYSGRQVHVIDGDKLKTDPIQVMSELQTFLHIEPIIDYSQKLKFDVKKGFYCQVMGDGKTKCLGSSKGRQYPPMDARSAHYLHQFYGKHNVALSRLLDRLNIRHPGWLQDELKS